MGRGQNPVFLTPGRKCTSFVLDVIFGSWYTPYQGTRVEVRKKRDVSSRGSATLSFYVFFGIYCNLYSDKALPSGTVGIQIESGGASARARCPPRLTPHPRAWRRWRRTFDVDEALAHHKRVAVRAGCGSAGTVICHAHFPARLRTAAHGHATLNLSLHAGQPPGAAPSPPPPPHRWPPRCRRRAPPQHPRQAAHRARRTAALSPPLELPPLLDLGCHPRERLFTRARPLTCRDPSLAATSHSRTPTS